MKRAICLAALLLLAGVLSACGGKQDRVSLFQPKETQNEDAATDSVDETQVEESESPAQESEPAAEEKQEEQETSSDDEPFSFLEPEPKLVCVIEEKSDGTIKNWTNYYYEGDVLSYKEDPLTNTYTYYDEKERELTTERAGYGILQEYRYDADDNIAYFQAQEVTSLELHDQAGNEICKVRHTTGMAAEYEYDERGRVTFSRIVSEDQDITFSYEYAEDGKLVAWESVDSDSEGTPYEWTYVTREFNDRGDLSRIYRYEEDLDTEKELDRVTYYIYDYDHIDPNQGDDYH